MLASAQPRAADTSAATLNQPCRLRVVAACPDSRTPGYEAAVGLAHVGDLQSFLTAYHHNPSGRLERLLEHLPGAASLTRRLRRRTHPGLPPELVQSDASVDLAIALENRSPNSAIRRLVVRSRAERFDRSVARHVSQSRPDVVLLFSDVGSVHTLDRCRELGIPSILSIVHGDIDEERVLLDRQRVEAPQYFPLYLGDGQLDETELAWLHQRRRREAELADMLLVPSNHIADRLTARGISADRIRVVPYAADLQRFRPLPARATDHSECTFVFAGGITQRKGISYLLDAWAMVHREGWRLRLVGPLPGRLGPLADRLRMPGVEWIGRVGHAEMPGLLAESDVFVFPSLFEGSAVVTYEALACGLPSIVTAEAGSVVRDGQEGLIVPSADAESLAAAMNCLGSDIDLRRRFSLSARVRAEAFSWTRYHSEVVRAARDLVRA